MLAGQVIITEGNWKSPTSRGIRWFTKSKWTHAFMVVSKSEAVEASFPRVRKFDLNERIAELEAEKRDYMILEYPGLTIQQRWRIAATSRSWVGRWYDIGQILIFVALGKFHKDGVGTVVCSRLITGAFEVNNKPLFTETEWNNLPDDYIRKDNLKKQMAVPADLVHSKLAVVREVNW